MTLTLMSLRERVEQMLADRGNVIWDRTWLEEAIRQALLEYSLINPQQAMTTLAISADAHELDISSISGLLAVTQVWVPYTSSNPEHPPNVRAFEHWVDSQTLYFPDYQLQNGETARLFYTKLRIISGLDGETTTTFPINHEILLAIGSAGYAATSRAVDLTEQVSVGQHTTQQVRGWGLSKLQEFRVGLHAVTRRLATRNPSRIDTPRLDRWDREGREWV